MPSKHAYLNQTTERLQETAQTACRQQHHPTCLLMVPRGLPSSSCKPVLRWCISSGLAAHTPASAAEAAARAAAAASSGSGHHTRMPDTEALVALSSGISMPHLCTQGGGAHRYHVLSMYFGCTFDLLTVSDCLAKVAAKQAGVSAQPLVADTSSCKLLQLRSSWPFTAVTAGLGTNALLHPCYRQALSQPAASPAASQVDHC